LSTSEALYRRRLTVLLVIGVIHFFFVWTWDILHLYALAGFLLLPLRRLSNRALLVADCCWPRSADLGENAGRVRRPGKLQRCVRRIRRMRMCCLRQQISESGDYLRLVGNFFDWVFVDYIASGMILGWLAYALGRFLIGAWVGRHGWVSRAWNSAGLAPPHAGGVALGLVLEGFATMLANASWVPEWEHGEFVAEALLLLAVPVLAADTCRASS
jgi:uncharacterized protein